MAKSKEVLTGNTKKGLLDVISLLWQDFNSVNNNIPNNALCGEFRTLEDAIANYKKALQELPTKASQS